MPITITKDNGEIVSRQYLERRVSAFLSRFRRCYSLDERRAAMVETVKNDNWLAAKNGQTVGSICRAVWHHI